MCVKQCVSRFAKKGKKYIHQRGIQTRSFFFSLGRDLSLVHPTERNSNSEPSSGSGWPLVQDVGKPGHSHHQRSSGCSKGPPPPKTGAALHIPEPAELHRLAFKPLLDPTHPKGLRENLRRAALRHFCYYLSIIVKWPHLHRHSLWHFCYYLSIIVKSHN